jgi:NADH pyrophosphatase NudC (nudix superfamily)
MAQAPKTTQERVKFRLIVMPCCQHQYCSVNPRLPTYCPQCGEQVYGRILADPSVIMISDDNAWLKYHK